MLSVLEGRERLLLELLWYTGARVSEVINSRVGDITDTGIVLRNLKQRRTDYKHVLLPKRFRERLKATVEGQPQQALLFPSPRNPNKPISRVWAWKIIKRAAMEAGVTKTRMDGFDVRLVPAWPHTLRHGYATALLLQGVPLTAVQRQLGHSNIMSTAVYTQIADPHLSHILEEVEI